MSAVLCSDRTVPTTNKHGSTFGGNPLACATALCAIEHIEHNDLTRRAREQGTYLSGLPRKTRSGRIREIRQIGIELKIKARPVLDNLPGRQVIALSSGTTVIRLLPPLVITHTQMETVAQALSVVLRDQHAPTRLAAMIPLTGMF